ncbi:MAG: hypothetical protein PWP08_1539 [Methanofollis sp.]|nr:hypothetical protein [Methanofollis sp.]
MDINFKRYGLYLIRWQLSTPILAGVIIVLSTMDPLAATVVANLIGGLIFFWVDRFIFTSKTLAAQWEVRDNIACVDCGKVCRGYRLVKTSNYDKTDDRKPEFRCEECSRKKSEELRRRGVNL